VGRATQLGLGEHALLAQHRTDELYAPPPTWLRTTDVAPRSG
jgi:hypothetical protein